MGRKAEKLKTIADRLRFGILILFLPQACYDTNTLISVDWFQWYRPGKERGRISICWRYHFMFYHSNNNYSP